MFDDLPFIKALPKGGRGYRVEGFGFAAAGRDGVFALRLDDSGRWVLVTEGNSHGQRLIYRDGTEAVLDLLRQVVEAEARLRAAALAA